jgi:catabolite regulation protein CreA
MFFERLKVQNIISIRHTGSIILANKEAEQNQSKIHTICSLIVFPSCSTVRIFCTKEYDIISSD